VIQQAKALAKRVIQSRIARHSSMLLIANWVTTALAMVTSFVLARLLGPTNYGLVIIAYTIVGTIVNFLDIRVGEGIVRFVGNALAREERREAVSFFYVGVSADIALMLATLLVSAIIAPLSARLYPEPELVRRLVLIYLLTIPFSTLEESFTALVNVYKRFNLLASGMILISLCRTITLTLLAPHGLVAVMWGYVIVSAFSFVLWAVVGLWLLISNIGRLEGKIGRADYIGAWRQFLPFAFHTSVIASLKAISANVDVLLLGALRTAAEVSYFNIAHNAATLIAIPTVPAISVIYPELNEAWARQDTKRSKSLIRRFSLISLAVSSACWLFLIVTADWLVWLFYGEAYAPVALLIRILGFGVVLDSVFRWVRPMAMAQNKLPIVTYYSIATILLRIALLIPFIHYLGAVGAALTFDIIMGVMILMIVVYAMPRLGLSLLDIYGRRGDTWRS